eukprot:1638451-Amphidinium_carterae.1
MMLALSRQATHTNAHNKRKKASNCLELSISRPHCSVSSGQVDLLKETHGLPDCTTHAMYLRLAMSGKER